MTALTDRMRTCAAHILVRKAEGDPWAVAQAVVDAADLLIEASNLIEPTVVAIDAAIVAQKNMPMEITAPGVWMAAGDTLPVAPRLRSPRACPKCDSRAQKTVRRKGNMLMLICPVCATEWQYQP